MDFKDLIKQLSDRLERHKSNVTTEEATKNAFIMPFLQALGYDVFSPDEVIPEFTADIGIKNGEKIDYAIMNEGKPVILIECKVHSNSLNVQNASQLFRYFHTTEAKFAILTNGVEYQFFTDLDSSNKMDDKPFFQFLLPAIKDTQIEELKKFHKKYYDFENIVNTASELKYTSQLKSLITAEMNNPSPDFVRYFAKQVYSSIVTTKVLDQFTVLVKRSFTQINNDIFSDKVAALSKPINEKPEEVVAVNEVENKIKTTEEEIDAFNIIKSILRSTVDVSRIFYRDTQSYFNVILDDNIRKTICRLYLSDKRKQIGIIDESKKEVKYELENLDSIFDLSDKLLSITILHNS